MESSPDRSRFYGTRFFERQLSASAERSARLVLPLVIALLRPTSAVDVGCGVGTWLSILRASGIDDILGIDGDYVNRRLLRIPQERFLAADLVYPIAIDRQFDLVISLEVAEHLPPDRAETFVTSLIGLGSAVLFSAAIPGQGGINHINERWQDYWVSLFEAKGYACLDVVRPRIWNDDRVEPQYRQNAFLFVSNDLLRTNGSLLQGLSTPAGFPRSVVHPRYFEAASKAKRRRPVEIMKETLPPRFKGALRAMVDKAARRGAR